MLENTHPVTALERSLDKRGQQVRIRMVPELSHRLQSLTYDFGYLCHITATYLRTFTCGRFDLLLGERCAPGFLRQPASNIDSQVTHIDLNRFLRLPPAHPTAA
jgi:hypothetical protein